VSASDRPDPVRERDLFAIYCGLYDASCAIWARTGDPDYPHRKIGSGTVCRWRGDWYVLTAAHVVERVPSRDVVLSLCMGGIAIITDTWRPGLPDPREVDEGDVTIFRIELPDLPEGTELSYVDIDMQTGPPDEYREHDTLVVSGFPGDAQEVDYVDGVTHVTPTAVCIPAEVVDVGTTPHCVKIRCLATLNLSSAGGLSGSPVFMWRGMHFWFAGMLTMGVFSETMVGYMIASEPLRSAFRAIETATDL